jgi:hypothetical protein
MDKVGDGDGMGADIVKVRFAVLFPSLPARFR